MRWQAVTVPGSDDRGRESPAEALDRIVWPEAVLREVAERLWTNAAIMISDQGISSETGKGTDFVVLTR